MKDSEEVRARDPDRVLRAVVGSAGDALMFAMDSFVLAFLVAKRSVGRVIQAVETKELAITGPIGRLLHNVRRFRASQNFHLSAIMPRCIPIWDQLFRVYRINGQRSTGLRRRDNGDLYVTWAFQLKVFVGRLPRLNGEGNLLLAGVRAHVSVIGRTKSMEDAAHFRSPIMSATGRARVHKGNIKLRPAFVGVLSMASWAFPNCLPRQRVRHTTRRTREGRNVFMSVHHEVAPFLSRAASMSLSAPTGSVFARRLRR